MSQVQILRHCSVVWRDWRGVVNSIFASGAIAVGQEARGLIAMKVADTAVNSIEENNNFDDRYLVDGLVPDSAKRGYSVNYAVAGNQVAGRRDQR